MTQRYTVVVAVPPWELPDPDFTDPDYHPLTADQIQFLPVHRLVADEAVLALIAPPALLSQALAVITAWDFVYVGKLTQVKFDTDLPPINDPLWQSGWWGKGQTTDVLFARRGYVRSPEEILQGLTGYVTTQNFLPAYIDLVEQTWPGPYLELFAKSLRPGWDTWGAPAVATIDLFAGLPEHYLSDRLVQAAMNRIRRLWTLTNKIPWEIGDILDELFTATKQQYRRSDLWRLAAKQMRGVNSHHFPMLMHRISVMVPPQERNYNRSWNTYRRLYNQVAHENAQTKARKRERTRHVNAWIDQTFGFVDRRGESSAGDQADAPHPQSSEGTPP